MYLLTDIVSGATYCLDQEVQDHGKKKKLVNLQLQRNFLILFHYPLIELLLLSIRNRAIINNCKTQGNNYKNSKIDSDIFSK